MHLLKRVEDLSTLKVLLISKVKKDHLQQKAHNSQISLRRKSRVCKNDIRIWRKHTRWILIWRYQSLSIASHAIKTTINQNKKRLQRPLVEPQSQTTSPLPKMQIKQWRSRRISWVCQRRAPHRPNKIQLQLVKKKPKQIIGISDLLISKTCLYQWYNLQQMKGAKIIHL